jgi:O-antigen ligase
MLVGFLPFVIGHYHLFMAVISWPEWPGYVYGTEITILDIIAAALYLSLPRAKGTLPFRVSMVLYFIAVLASTFQAQSGIAALFYSWQLARMFLMYAVVARACADQRVVPALLTGMAVALCLEACDTLYQRAHGMFQVGGTLGHQNLLGLMSEFVVFPWLALLLAGQRGWQPVTVPFAGAVVAVMTVSRATLGLAGVGWAVLFILSALRQWTPRKALILAGGAAALTALAPVILSSFERRFGTQLTIESDYDDRAAFISATEMMLADHPFGVGANNYVVSVNSGGYNDRAGVIPQEGSENAHVHNIYLLVAAETGYIGLVTFLLMVLQLLVVAFRCGWRSRGDPRGDLLLGVGTSLLIVLIHSNFEWVAITYPMQYMLALEAGVIAGLAEQLGYWRRAPVGIRVGGGRAIEPIAKAARN